MPLLLLPWWKIVLFPEHEEARTLEKRLTMKRTYAQMPVQYPMVCRPLNTDTNTTLTPAPCI